MKRKSLTKLSINGAKFYANHGVTPEEREVGGKYEVDVDLWYDATNAIINDDVQFAMNYEEAYFVVSELITGESYNLIETLANEINNMLMEKFPQAMKVAVKVRKITVPIRGILNYVEAEQTIEREGFNE